MIYATIRDIVHNTDGYYAKVNPCVVNHDISILPEDKQLLCDVLQIPFRTEWDTDRTTALFTLQTAKEKLSNYQSNKSFNRVQAFINDCIHELNYQFRPYVRLFIVDEDDIFITVNKPKIAATTVKTDNREQQFKTIIKPVTTKITGRRKLI